MFSVLFNVAHPAIIASRAVVTKNVEPYAIVGSNPAKHIRYRFTENEITQLQKMQWWSWSDEQVKGAMKFLCSSDTTSLYAYWQNQVHL